MSLPSDLNSVNLTNQAVIVGLEGDSASKTNHPYNNLDDSRAKGKLESH